jgi:tetratricopeptide (TPR) repeat protein
VLRCSALVDADRLSEVASSNESIGDILLARGDLSGALAAYRASLVVRDELAAAALQFPERQRDLAVSHALVAEVLEAAGDLDGAVAAYRASLKVTRRLASAHPDNAQYQRDLDVSFYKLALAAEQGGCERARRECLKRAEEVFLAMKRAGMCLDAPARRVFAAIGQPRL